MRRFLLVQRGAPCGHYPCCGGEHAPLQLVYYPGVQPAAFVQSFAAAHAQPGDHRAHACHACSCRCRSRRSPTTHFHAGHSNGSGEDGRDCDTEALFANEGHIDSGPCAEAAGNGVNAEVANERHEPEVTPPLTSTCLRCTCFCACPSVCENSLHSALPGSVLQGATDRRP